jgi:hypothetical protein
MSIVWRLDAEIPAWFIIPIPDPLQKVSLISYRNLLRNTPKNLDLNLRN